MNSRNITITRTDLDRLRRLIPVSLKLHPNEYRYLNDLVRELDRAEVMEYDEIPDDVVTMYSTVVVRIVGRRQKQTWTIVYPAEADMDSDRISVLAPIGTALLGYRVGDTVEWTVPAGRRRFRIEKVMHKTLMNKVS